MWYPEKMLIKNLCSHKNTTFDFLKDKCVVIFGEIKNEHDTDSNGSGKSTLIEGITLALTGETCRDVDKEEFINDDEETCEVELSLNNLAYKKHLRIVRRFYRGKKSAQIELYENKSKEPNKQITSVAEANSRICELLGISKKDLLNYYIIGQDTQSSFFQATDGDKKEILSRLTNFSIIEKSIKTIDLELNPFIIKKKQLEDEILVTTTEISVKTDNLEYEKENYEFEIKEQIEDNLNKLEEIKSSIKERKRKIQQVTDNIKDLSLKEEKIGKVDQSKVDIINKKISSKKRTVSEISDEQEEAEIFIQNTKVKLKGKIDCPKCKHSFIPDCKEDVRTLKKLLEQCTELVEDCKNNYKQEKESIKLLNEKLEKLNENEVLIKSLKTQIKSSEQELNSINSRLNDDLKELKKKSEKIEDLERQLKDNTKIKKLQQELKELKASIDPIEQQIEEINKSIKQMELLKFHFSKKGFLTYLANKAVKTIEGATNLVLKKISSKLSVEIDGYKVLKNGDIREKITTYIYKNGYKQGTYHKYSGGEKVRVDIAGIVSINDSINKTSEYGGLNLIVLDEKFEGLDRKGQKSVLNILNSLNKTIIVISHINNDIGFENRVVVEKDSKGNSTVKTLYNER